MYPVDKKDPEFLRQRQVEYQREYRKRQAEKREKAKIDEMIAQQYVATVPELQNKVLLMEGEIKTKDEVSSAALAACEATLQQYAAIVQELQNKQLLMGNEIRTKDEVSSAALAACEATISRQEAEIQQQSNNLRAKDEVSSAALAACEATISRQEAEIQQQSNDLRVKDEQYGKLQEEMNRQNQIINQLAPYANVGKIYSPFIDWLATQYPHVKADLDKYYSAYLQSCSL